MRRRDGVPHYARYDPPWTPSFLRRNEILIEVNLATDVDVDVDVAATAPEGDVG